MPLHDWTRVPSGLYHDFHQGWCLYIRNQLNAGRLPAGYSALVEQRTGAAEAGVLAVRDRPARPPAGGGTATVARPAARVVRTSNRQFYAARASRVTVKHRLGRTVAVIEVVSPGNKHGAAAVREFVDKSVGLLQAGVHLSVVDPFPPTPRDPAGLHPLVWAHTEDDEGLDFPPGHDRTLASYLAGPVSTAFVETLGVGDPLPDMPRYLKADEVYVTVPLGPAYDEAWAVTPEPLRQAVLTGQMPPDEGEGG
jgi:hypothetical protein